MLLPLTVPCCCCCGRLCAVSLPCRGLLLLCPCCCFGRLLCCAAVSAAVSVLPLAMPPFERLAVRTTCRGCDLPWMRLDKAIGFKEDKIQGVQGVQEQEPAGANSERSNLRPFVSVGTQGLTSLSARGLIRLAFEKKASKAFKEEKREDLFSSRLCFCGVANASLEVPKKAGCGV
ncbi:hypothetical protein Ae201684P_005090 [Aphanomyces euteiches]|nr:hypothetical protein Ae201684P_009595 [Aphanomyces euteiches]KAH9085382.1 hypothetical protein Ae201684P_005090 [Aphanomyces euteiches]